MEQVSQLSNQSLLVLSSQLAMATQSAITMLLTSITFLYPGLQATQWVLPVPISALLAISIHITPNPQFAGKDKNLLDGMSKPTAFGSTHLLIAPSYTLLRLTVAVGMLSKLSKWYVNSSFSDPTKTNGISFDWEHL